MQEADPRDEIVRLEARLEALAETIEGCRKFILASRVAIAAGGIMLLALLIGAIGFNPVALLAALTAVIGGIVLLGSHSSTLQEASAELNSAEQMRAELIGRIDLRVVSEADVRRLNGSG